MQIYIATSHDPFYNLAVENWLFHHKLADQPILYLWQNTPCVVIGRAQNPWRETHLTALNTENIPIVRRQSGGGTVFHDLGNINYTILSPNHCYDKRANLQYICSILHQLDLQAYHSPRNDILINGLDGQPYKISGSAFRETKDKSFHHGTLLINSDTSRLYHYLHQPIDQNLEAKGVASHRSKVINLAQLKTSLTVEKVLDAFMASSNESPILLSHQLNDIEITTEMNKLKDWEWRFGKTLPFIKNSSFKDQAVTLQVEKGRLSNINGITLSNHLQQWLATLPRYCHSSIDTLLADKLNPLATEPLIQHLQTIIPYTSK